jgi:hypothetical protein
LEETRNLELTAETPSALRKTAENSATFGLDHHAKSFAHAEEKGFELHAAAKVVLGTERRSELIGLSRGKQSFGESFKSVKAKTHRFTSFFERREVHVRGDVLLSRRFVRIRTL